MKLVDILARELTEWPKSQNKCRQDWDGEICFDEDTRYDFHASEMADDYNPSPTPWSSIEWTEKSQWESARAAYLLTQQPAQDPQLSKIGKSMPKAHKDGWIRHRGGKCPVDDGTSVEVRLRCGAVFSGVSKSFDWRRDGSSGDIMSWRTVNVEANEDAVIHHEAPEETTIPVFDPVSLRQQWESLGHEIKSNECSIKSIQEAIAGLVERQKAIEDELKAAGFLIYAEVDQVKVDASEDMSDPKNWREGDVFTVTQTGAHSFNIGETVKMIVDDGSNMKRYMRLDNRENYFVRDASLKFHSRP